MHLILDSIVFIEKSREVQNGNKKWPDTECPYMMVDHQTINTKSDLLSPLFCKFHSEIDFTWG